ncbi:MAG TPA: hypothetical protein PLR16_01110 [Bacilli bacterium]|nr:MAG: hypothetical protein BWY97_00385 [Tenericutes bacterium ADurb.BinA124]HNZ50720.1 hypothetical protein [Bacilli bacterium]HPX83867.1 hypothetical protein [Bacilli bacterium]
MRLSKMLGVRKFAVRTTAVTIGLLITAFLSIAIAIITFYGQQAGNFVMSIDPDSFTRGIILSSDDKFLAPSPRLLANPVIDVKDITYSWLKLSEIKATDGDYIDEDYRYVAYTFYVKNIGSETVDVGYHLKITDTYKNVDEAVRILIIEDDTDEYLYQKPDTVPYDYPKEMPKANYFIDDEIVTRGKIANLRPHMYKKYSVIMWLEGEDPDCVDSILGGMIRIQMKFDIVGAEE